MRHSKLVLLSTLSAVALLTASTTSPAFAPSVTDMGLLRPHNTWQIGSISAKNSNYCAMVSQFDKEISLAFARNPAGAGSLAIDFPGNILETGMVYEVLLQVDDMEARRYNVRAASPRSLIVQIGQDEDFYSSLGSNGTLHIGLPTVDMRFDLRKFSGSYISLVTCADKLPQHEGPRTAAMPVTPVEQAPLATTKQANTKQDASKTAAAASPALAPVALKTPNDLQAQMDTVRESLSKKSTDTPSAPPVVAAKAPSPAPVAAVASTSGSGIIWSTAAKKLPDTLPVVATSTTSKPAAAPIKLRDETDNVVAENMELKSKISQLELEKTELANSTNLYKSERNDLQAKLDMKEKQTQMLEAALNVKDTDLSNVRALSNNDSKGLADAQLELASVKRERDAAVADLQTKLTEKTAAYDNLQKQFTDGAVLRRTAQEKSVESQAELETLRQRLTQAQEQISTSEQQKSELSTQVEFQGQQNKTLLQRVQDQLNKATQQVSMLESQLTSVGMQRDDLNAQLDAEVNKNKALAASLEVKQQELAYHAAPLPAAPVPETASAADMNLLGHASAPPSLPAVASEDVPAVKAAAGSARGSAANPAGGDWDTVVVQ